MPLRTDRVWKIEENRGDLGDVTIAFDIAGLGFPSNDHNDYVLLVDDDGVDWSNAIGLPFDGIVDDSLFRSSDNPGNGEFWSIGFYIEPATAGAAFPSPYISCPFQPATLFGDVTGTPDSVRWQVSSTGGASFVNLFDLSPYAGAGSQSLNILPLTPGLDGNIYRMLIYSCGTTPSDTTEPITIELLPEFVPPELHPAPGTNDFPADGPAYVVFSDTIFGSVIGPDEFPVQGFFTGNRSTSMFSILDTIFFFPDRLFEPGELVHAGVTPLLFSDEGCFSEQGFNWQFRTATSPACGTFTNSGHFLSSGPNAKVSVGDVDADGDIDIILTGNGTGNQNDSQ